MLPEINKLAVNWQDGMKVKTEHFNALENFIRDGIRDSLNIGLTEYCYGLLPSSNGAPSSLKLKCDLIAVKQQLKVVLVVCRAITAGGIRIERREEENMLSGSTWIDCFYSLEKNSDTRLDVVVSVDLFTKIAVGDPDPNENPPRRPYVLPKYTLKINPYGSPINQTNELKVGEIVVEGDEAKISKEYLPPCSRLNCYQPLLEIYHSMEASLKVILGSSILLMQKFKSGKTTEGAESNIVRNNLQFFMEHLLFFCANNLELYRRIIPSSPPLFFIEFFIRLARILHTSLKCMDDPARHSLLNYFRQWGTDFAPGNFENALAETLDMTYNHENIRSNINQIEKFFVPLDKLLEVLPKREFKDFELDIIQDMR